MSELTHDAKSSAAGQSPAAVRDQVNDASNMRLPIQRRLSIGDVDDPLEHQADAMADRVMRMPDPAFIQRKCAHCEEEERVNRKPLASFIQKKANDGGTVHASDSATSTINATRGTGNTLSESTKTFMESRFGADFSDVRIHTGSYASQLSTELSAQAFTVGNDIYFNSGKFSEGTDEGKHLLAHELTHTLQQSGTIRRQPTPTPPTQPTTTPDVRINPDELWFGLRHYRPGVAGFYGGIGFNNPLGLAVPGIFGPSTLNSTIGFDDDCNRTLQGIGLQYSRTPPFAGGASSNSLGADASVRFGDTRYGVGVTAGWNGGGLTDGFLTFTVTPGVSTVIPERCRPRNNDTPPTTPRTDQTTDPNPCAGVDCTNQATSLVLRQLCCSPPQPATEHVPLQFPDQTVYFWHDTNVYKGQISWDVLDLAQLVLNLNPHMHVLIKGHTSIEGTDQHNLELSERRANAVKAYLVAHHVLASRISTLALGEVFPAVQEPPEPRPGVPRPAAEELVRDRNRRAEIVFFGDASPRLQMPTFRTRRSPFRLGGNLDF